MKNTSNFSMDELSYGHRRAFNTEFEQMVSQEHHYQLYAQEIYRASARKA